jgi:hypothetical protein
LEIKVELIMVSMPNFLRVKQRAGRKQDGFKEGITIPVEDLSIEEAAEYADEMRESFMDHWRKLKKQ